MSSAPATTVVPTSPSGKLSREAAFDQWAVLGGLRFLLASIVVLEHCNSFRFRHSFSWTDTGAILSGQAAVIGFLLISGYSMAHSLRRPKGFYARRLRRIIPLYLAGLLLGLLVVKAGGGSVVMPGGQIITTPGLWEFAGNTLLLQGWVTTSLTINGPLWSLSVEGFYYAIAPLLKALRPWMFCLLIWVSAAAACAADQHVWLMKWGYAMLVLAWAWIGGFYWYRHRKSSTSLLLFAIGCVMPRLLRMPDFAELTIVFTIATLIAAPTLPLHRTLRAPLLYLGELSYPLYVFHWPAIIGMFALGHVTNAAGWVIGSLGMSIIGYHLIDRLFRTSPLARAGHLKANQAQ